MANLHDAVMESLGEAADMVGVVPTCDCVCPGCRLGRHCAGFYCDCLASSTAR